MTANFINYEIRLPADARNAARSDTAWQIQRTHLHSSELGLELAMPNSSSTCFVLVYSPPSSSLHHIGLID